MTAASQIRMKGMRRPRIVWSALVAGMIAVMLAVNWTERHSSFESMAQQRCCLLLWSISAVGLIVGAWIDRPRVLRSLVLTGSLTLLLGAGLGTIAWPDGRVQVFTALPLFLGASGLIWPDGVRHRHGADDVDSS